MAVNRFHFFKSKKFKLNDFLGHQNEEKNFLIDARILKFDSLILNLMRDGYSSKYLNIQGKLTEP